jgi:hypothetical protein
MLLGLFYVSRPYFSGFENIWQDYNKALVFLGLGISFSTLQDTTKTQNKFSQRIWENARYTRIALICITILALYFIVVGLFCLFQSSFKALSELSFGIIAVGIGMVGLLKSAIEMAEHHGGKVVQK